MTIALGVGDCWILRSKVRSTTTVLLLIADSFSLNGVAPEATIRSYKIFGCSGSVYEDVIIEAFIRAFEEGADIITASLVSDRGFPSSPL